MLNKSQIFSQEKQLKQKFTLEMLITVSQEDSQDQMESVTYQNLIGESFKDLDFEHNKILIFHKETSLLEMFQTITQEILLAELSMVQ